MKMDVNQFSQAVLPAAKGGLGVSSARLLASRAFLASAVGAKDALSEIFDLEHVDGIYNDALERWFELGKIEMAPKNEIQKNWTEQQLRIAIGLLLGSKISERHKYVCGKDVTMDSWHGISGLKSAGRFSRHSNLNAIIKQSLSSNHIPSVLEPRHLYRTNQKRLDGLTLVPWAVGKQLLWDVTVVDSLAPCRINAGSVCNTGTAAVFVRN